VNPRNPFEIIDQKWQHFWEQNATYRTPEVKPGQAKYYVLDMFPYPSGAGLHVGHPLGYIASDVVARVKRMQGMAVLHPMGFDAFGLPAEQYAIQTGQHPQVTTAVNSARYREQLQQLGFSFDWERQISTCDPSYYRWTQWMFLQLFDSWFDRKTSMARPVSELIARMEQEGSAGIDACGDDTQTSLTAEEWRTADAATREQFLMGYRLAYRAMAKVNWCPALGTVLANDEVKDGYSERGGHPVEPRWMPQWMLRISAYAPRLLEGLNELQWSDSIKEHQRNWIGRSHGARISFRLEALETVQGQTAPPPVLDVFTTRPDTLYGVSFMVVAPEHPLLGLLTTDQQEQAVQTYLDQIKGRSERERQAETRKVTGCFTGSYALHPLHGGRIPVWTSDYVLAGYGTGAIMAVPCGDARDWNFARHFNLPVPELFVGHAAEHGACEDKGAILQNSGFLDGLTGEEAILVAIARLEETGLGRGVTHYRIRDAVFSRQRYWGEPVPMSMQENGPTPLPESALPLVLPNIDQYLPTAEGEPPLARAEDWTYRGHPLETTTMPGWAGSSWYFLRYMDPHNRDHFAAPEALASWGPVDLYLGGSEHATGHLLYARFWNHFLYDRGWVPFREPFVKLINQGMIQGVSEYLFRSLPDYPASWWMQHLPEQHQYPHAGTAPEDLDRLQAETILVSDDVLQHIQTKAQGPGSDSAATTAPLPENLGYSTSVDISFVDQNHLHLTAFMQETTTAQQYPNALWISMQGYSWQGSARSWSGAHIEPEDFVFLTRSEVEKMSKSKRNVVNPDSVVAQYGADTLRMYELFLGPLEDSKPWDTQGIEGVYRYLQKVLRTYQQALSEKPSDEPDAAGAIASMKVLHRCTRKVSEGLDRMALNTCVSAMMIGLHEIQAAKIKDPELLGIYARLLAPFAPHLAEELWEMLGQPPSIHHAPFPTWDPELLEEQTFAYPVQHNGKLRFQVELPARCSSEELCQLALAHPKIAEWLEGRRPKKVVAVPGRIINFVL